MSILVAVPVLNRPHRAQPLADSLHASQGKETLRLLFICTPGDRKEITAVKKTGAQHVLMPTPNGPGDYARKINHAVHLMQEDEDWLFTGADDLHFHPGWADHALACAHRFGQHVVGTHDQLNPSVIQGRHSTHTLVHRTYIHEHGTIEQPGLVYHEGYAHNWCDAEMIETAKARRQFVFCPQAIVEHLHHLNNKAPDDTTYQLGQTTFKQDHRLYSKRRRKWSRGRAYSRNRYS